MRPITATLALSLGLALPLSAGVTITEINPVQSTRDAADPDGASGGRVNGLANVPGDNQVLYAASEWGGLYKTTDGGLTWTRLDNHIPVVTWDVEVDPRNTDRVFATSFYDGRVNSLAGINVSNDGGATWTHPASQPPVGFCLNASRRTEPSAFGISVDPDTGRAYIGTNCGLAVSDDGGVTWTWIDPTPADGADNVWDVVVHDGGIVDLCGDDGHRRSTDGGATWSTATGQALPSGRCSLAVSPDESYVLFASVGLSIFESDDGGADWGTTFVNPSAQGRIPFLVTNQRSGDAFDLWFGDIRLWRASCTTTVPPVAGARCPASATWAGPFTRSNGGHDDCGDLVFDSQQAADRCPQLFSSDGGVYYNTDSNTATCHTPSWEQPNVTPRSLWLWTLAGSDVATVANEDLYFGAQDNGTFYAPDAGAATPAWLNHRCCDGFDVVADATRALHTRCCFAGQNRLFISNPGYASNAQISNVPAGNIPGFGFIDVLDQFGPNAYVLMTTSGVFITTNVAATPTITWTQLGAATSPAGACGVRAAGTARNPTFYVQAGNCSGNGAGTLWRYNGTAATNNWTQINPPGNTGGFGIFDVDPNDPNRLFVSHLSAAGPQMMRSDDGGGTWNGDATLDNLMTGSGVYQYRNQRGPTNWTNFGGYAQPTLVAFDPEDEDVIVAGAADAGVFLSTDDGASWITMTDGSGGADNPIVPRPHFAYFDHDDGKTNVYVGTQGRGVWRFTYQQTLDLCDRFPRLCGELVLVPEVIEIFCAEWPCVVIDDLPENCLYKFDCPGCPPGGLCPPWYHLFLDDVPPDFHVGLIDFDGNPVEHQLSKTPTGLVLSFRPSKELFEEGSIGRYSLVIQAGPRAELGKHRIGTRLEVGKGPYGRK